MIAVISDVHALKEPLEAVLKAIKEEGIEEIYSLGDNIGLGPNPKEVLDLLEEYNVKSIAGNHEEYLNIGTKPFYYLNGDDRGVIRYTTLQLTDKQKQQIREYPKFIELTIANKKIALCHFINDVRCDFDDHSTWSYQNNPERNYGQFYYTNSHGQLDDFGYKLNIPAGSYYLEEDTTKRLEMLRDYLLLHPVKDPYKRTIESYIKNPLFYTDNILKTVNDYDIVIQGHVHFSSVVQSDKTLFHTMRGLAMGDKDNKDKASYIVLKEENNDVIIEERVVHFDREGMRKSIENANYPNQKALRYTN